MLSAQVSNLTAKLIMAEIEIDYLNRKKVEHEDQIWALQRKVKSQVPGKCSGSDNNTEIDISEDSRVPQGGNQILAVMENTKEHASMEVLQSLSPDTENQAEGL